MKLLGFFVLGMLFATTLSKADEVALTEKDISELHAKLNVCDVDAKQNGVPMYDLCSTVQAKLLAQYEDHSDYLAARRANQ